MLLEVNARDRDMWREIGQAISQSLRNEILNTPVGEELHELLGAQVELIRSIPLEAAQRVHTLTIQGLETGSRAKEIAAEIRNSGPVAESRAMLIARTEVSRTASVLVEARAKSAGSVAYMWQTAHDSTVRPSHREMQGKLVQWDDPPTLDGLTGHAGALPNCRCYPEPIFDRSKE